MAVFPGSAELIFYNSALSLPMLLLGFFASGEASRLGEFPSWSTTSFQVTDTSPNLPLS